MCRLHLFLKSLVFYNKKFCQLLAVNDIVLLCFLQLIWWPLHLNKKMRWQYMYILLVKKKKRKFLGSSIIANRSVIWSVLHVTNGVSRSVNFVWTLINLIEIFKYFLCHQYTIQTFLCKLQDKELKMIADGFTMRPALIWTSWRMSVGSY